MPVDLPLYIFLTILANAVTPLTLLLAYSVLLTHFLKSMMVPEVIDVAKGTLSV